MINVVMFPGIVKRLQRLLLVLAFLVAVAGTVCSAVAAQTYIIVDATTGAVLDSQKPRDKRQIGSLTKIATAMVVLDWAEHRGGDLNQIATIPPAAFVGVTENNIGFQPGDTMDLRDLLYAALVQSDNIAAYTLANHVGSTLGALIPTASGSKITPVIAFVSQMNALAKELRMERTRFVNPHGSDYKVKPLPFSTAEDMARLTRYAMTKASFRFYVSQKERLITFQRGGRAMHYMTRNTNELLGMRGIDGVKTGSTTRAGDCLVLSATRDPEVNKIDEDHATVYPRRIVVVLLGSADRFREGSALVDKGWQLYDQWAAGGRLLDPNKTL
jgi:serine-type D-Ala-D-Ala carboxypeptidase (penicillin-binding protein 5/6)